MEEEQIQNKDELCKIKHFFNYPSNLKKDPLDPPIT